VNSEVKMGESFKAKIFFKFKEEVVSDYIHVPKN
jgi:hypothetical protein